MKSWNKQAKLLLISSAMSLISYEQSYGNGNGIDDARDIQHFLEPKTKQDYYSPEELQNWFIAKWSEME